MDKNEFEKLLKERNFVKINDNFIVFNDFEVFNIKKNKSQKFNNINAIFENQEIKKIIESSKDFEIQLNGGRGSSSMSSQLGGGFTNANLGGGGGEGSSIFPARLNVGSVNKTQEQAIRKFEKQYKDATIEYAASIDADGFAHSVRSGGATSVRPGITEKMMIVHNHPSGGNFSKADLLNTASSKKQLGIIAVGSNTKNRYRYVFEKTGRFKAKEFAKAVENAKWPISFNYDDGSHWWLKKNSKTYGYKYKRIKI